MKLLLDIDLKDRIECFKLLNDKQICALAEELGNGWTVEASKRLEKEFLFDSYAQGVAFANHVAALSEQLNHHADILIAYKRVRLMIWTHNVGGLTKADFVLAARIVPLFEFL
jgi:4a-hydroxytetrahydrobiopterin dehydratase